MNLIFCKKHSLKKATATRTCPSFSARRLPQDWRTSRNSHGNARSTQISFDLLQVVTTATPMRTLRILLPACTPARQLPPWQRASGVTLVMLNFSEGTRNAATNGKTQEFRSKAYREVVGRTWDNSACYDDDACFSSIKSPRGWCQEVLCTLLILTIQHLRIHSLCSTYLYVKNAFIFPWMYTSAYLLPMHGIGSEQECATKYHCDKKSTDLWW